MNDYMNKSPVGTQSAMRMIWESVEIVSGEPYTTDELSAKADPDRYVWENEQADWASTHGLPAEI